LHQKGTNPKKVLDELRIIQKHNQQYETGKILCSMCTKPHPIAKKAYTLFFESNLGDTGLFPATAQLEQETITQLADLLNCKTAEGFIVSGGTEANLLALTAARNQTQKAEPEVILPESAHFSFTKACNLLKIQPKYAPLDNNFRVKPYEVESLVNKNTIAIVATAGSAELGAIDPIESISEIAENNKINFHVDAAFGGLIIPFLPKNSPKFDFQLSGVTSITVDPHKMGMAAIPTGGILFRSKKMLNHLKTETPYLSTNSQYTLTGTRSGASAASAWAVFNALGQEGYRKIVRRCLSNTEYLVGQIHNLGFKLLCKPELNVFAFQTQNTKEFAEKLWKKGWCISYIPRYECIRVVVMPHIKRVHAKAFATALKTEKL